MKRREFLRNTIYIPAIGATLVYAFAGCSDDDTTAATGNSTNGPEPVGTCTTVSAVIGSNHEHTVTPPAAAQVTGGADITLNLTLGAGHTHTVTLTVADLDTISTCGTVAILSSLNGHRHSVSFTGSI